MKAKSRGRKLAIRRQVRQGDNGMEIAATPRRKKQGAKRMAEIKAEADADIPALIARCRRQGKQATKESMADAKQPWHGCEAVGGGDVDLWTDDAEGQPEAVTRENGATT